MNLQELESQFRKKITNREWRNRKALLGDALLRLEAVRVGLSEMPDKTAGQVTDKINHFQTNDFMIKEMKGWGIVIEAGWHGKVVADAFEAWIGFLYEQQPMIGVQFCQQYSRHHLGVVQLKSLSEVTSGLIGE